MISLDTLKNELQLTFPTINFKVEQVDDRPIIRWQGNAEPEEVKNVMVLRGIPNSSVTYFKSECTIREE